MKFICLGLIALVQSRSLEQHPANEEFVRFVAEDDDAFNDQFSNEIHID